jgi:hypothetical protein
MGGVSREREHLGAPEHLHADLIESYLAHKCETQSSTAGDEVRIDEVIALRLGSETVAATVRKADGHMRTVPLKDVRRRNPRAVLSMLAHLIG